MRISTSMIYNNGVQAFQNRSAEMLQLQTQFSSGKRVTTPSDDPLASASALVVSQAKSVNSQWAVNRGSAKDALSTLDTTLGSVSDLIAYIKERTIQAGNGSLGASDLQAIAIDLRARFDQMVAYANTNDPQGGYMFAGYRTDTQPFIGNLSSGIFYQGDQGSRAIQISDSRVIPTSNSGNDVFMNIPSGNGFFSTSGDSGNSGGAAISAGTVSGTYSGNNYQIVFTSATDYDIYDTTAGGPAVASGSYTSGDPISIGGVTVNVVGAPASGDKFNITAGGSTDIFSTLKDLIGALENSSGDAFQAQVGKAMGNLDSALENVLRVRASVGSRINEVQSLDSFGSQLDVQYADTISRLTDLDYAQASSDLVQKQLALQASQKAFVQTTGLSLFNYLT
ncbi:MAG: flagellar hook-associated protein FlgL [Betaproteobacteria bacterium]|nr:flagellar hook-associated protein FlgL [Betaproteobacteria bacterium]